MHCLNTAAVQALGSCATTAQVHPRKLTEAFVVRAAALAGSTVRVGRVDGITTAADATAGRRVTGVTVDGEPLAATQVVLAMGPWTGAAKAWLSGVPAVQGQRYHSAVLRTDADVRPQ